MAKRPQGFCVFCGGTPVTRQHVLPDWLKNVIPRTSQSHVQDLLHVAYLPQIGPEEAVAIPQFLERQGPVGSRKVRNVCLQCNGGWMSRLEQKAKPILVPLIRGEPYALGLNEQAVLAAWATMTTMMMEFTAPDSRLMVIPPEQREQFKRTQLPPYGWRVWIGYQGANAWNFRIRQSAKGVRPSTVPRLPQPNAQLTTIGLEKLVFHVRSSKGVHFPMDGGWQVFYEGLIPICPFEELEIHWPPRQLLLQQDLDAIADGTGMIDRGTDALPSFISRQGGIR